MIIPANGSSFQFPDLNRRTTYSNHRIKFIELHTWSGSEIEPVYVNIYSIDGISRNTKNYQSMNCTSVNVSGHIYDVTESISDIHDALQKHIAADAEGLFVTLNSDETKTESE